VLGPTGNRRTLMVLPDETRVLPGHMLETTIGRERQTNPFVLQELHNRR